MTTIVIAITKIISRHKAITVATKIILMIAIVTIELAVGTTRATTAGIARTLKMTMASITTVTLAEAVQEKAIETKRTLGAMTIISTLTGASATRSIEWQ